MAFELIIGKDPDQRRQMLDAGEFLLGSGADCEVRIDRPTVSRRHARLRLGERIELLDLDSRNGSYVDGVRAAAGTWLPCDIGSALRLGSLPLQVRRLQAGDDSLALVLADAASPVQVDSAEATLALGALDRFSRGALVLLLRQAAQGATRAELGRALGEALMQYLPLTALRLGPIETTDEYWFAAGKEPSECWQSGMVALGLGVASGHSSNAYRDLAGLADALLALSCERTASTTECTTPDWPTPEPLDPATRRLYRQAQRVAGNPLHVLIRGESGTGKELLAQFIHRHSAQADRPWVAVNCAAFAEDLLEAELFGVERGVATGVEARAGLFERADGGTLFLDEIGDMALATQARILRVLQSREVWRLGASKPRPARFRMISATHKDLAELRRQGVFRDDLWHRIADWEACLPPLRERLDDVGNLALYFLGRAASRRGVTLRGITRRALGALLSYDWPGNIRELEREMQRCAVFLDHGAALTAEDLRPAIRAASPTTDHSLTLAGQLQVAEKRIIELALRRGGNIDATAAELGISRATLYRRMAAHGIAAHLRE